MLTVDLETLVRAISFSYESRFFLDLTSSHYSWKLEEFSFRQWNLPPCMSVLLFITGWGCQPATNITFHSFFKLFNITSCNVLCIICLGGIIVSNLSDIIEICLYRMKIINMYRLMGLFIALYVTTNLLFRLKIQINKLKTEVNKLWMWINTAGMKTKWTDQTD